MRRATRGKVTSGYDQSDFYPRSPCGERHCIIDIINNIIDNFYPRSPCGERRFYPLKTFIILSFLSTLSLRRATHYGWSWYDDFTISIHALLAESDHQQKSGNRKAYVDFYPRSPCGERQPPRVIRKPATGRFLSTLSLRRATSENVRSSP